jgi:hypothetical protein
MRAEHERYIGCNNVSENFLVDFDRDPQLCIAPSQ